MIRAGLPFAAYLGDKRMHCMESVALFKWRVYGIVSIFGSEFAALGRSSGLMFLELS